MRFAWGKRKNNTEFGSLIPNYDTHDKSAE